MSLYDVRKLRSAVSMMKRIVKELLDQESF